MSTAGLLSDVVATLASDENNVDDEDVDDGALHACCFFSSAIILYLVCKAAWSAGLVLRFKLSPTMELLEDGVVTPELGIGAYVLVVDAN